MKIFNIRYECLDQRDDFFSELNRGGIAGPGLINSDLAADNMNLNEVLDEISIDNMAPDHIDVDDQQSKRYMQQLKTMSVTKHIMTRLGWTACEPNASQDSDVSIHHEPVSGISVGSEWKEVVASKR